MKGRKKREGTGVCMCEVVMGAGEHNQVRGRKKREVRKRKKREDN